MRIIMPSWVGRRSKEVDPPNCLPRTVEFKVQPGSEQATQPGPVDSSFQKRFEKDQRDNLPKNLHPTGFLGTGLGAGGKGLAGVLANFPKFHFPRGIIFTFCPCSRFAEGTSLPMVV